MTEETHPRDSAATKRSRMVSTVLVAGAGLAALQLGALDRTGTSQTVLVYPDAAACAAEAIRTAEACRQAYDTASAAYPSAAPHYGSSGLCEHHHGIGQCLPAPGADWIDSLEFVPRMAGYLIGREESDGVTPEPVYAHRQGHGEGPGHGSFCTGSGGKVSTGTGAHASSGTLKSAAGQPTKFGGFGATGKSVSFGGS